MSCHGCKCDRCVRNAEIGLSLFTPGEFDDVEKLCYFCGECKHFDGDYKKRSRWRPECDGFKEAIKSIEARARAARAKFKVISGGKKT